MNEFWLLLEKEMKSNEDRMKLEMKIDMILFLRWN